MNFSIIVFLLITVLLHWVYCDDSVLSSQFYTNYFTDNDFGSWSIIGTNIPADHLFSQCGGERIFGGYGRFTGDQNGPTKISRQYIGLIAHYAVRVQAKIYKIDSYNDENIFIMADNVAQKIYNFQSTNSTQNICGDTFPVIDNINKNFNDTIIVVDFMMSHNSSSLNVSIETDLKSNKGWWGVREVSVTLLECDKSCLTCTNASACTSCDTSITGVTLIGAYCECTVLATIKQLTTQCTAMPCLTCVTSCSPGYYYSVITTKCESCNAACSTCSGPSNGVFPSCGSCANGFFRNSPLTDPCYSCPGYCLTCSALNANACTSCKQGYFLFGTQCLSSCPNGTYPQQSSRQCFPCSISCLTCDGATGFYCTSCTGSLYLSLNTNQCLPTCSPPYFKYNNKCLQQCPVGTFEDFNFYLCTLCQANCNECTNSTSCAMCTEGYLLLNGLCMATCPTNYYVSQTSGECVSCHPDCLQCFGGTQTSCIICSDGTKILLNGTCYTQCPNRTFSSTCQPCHSSCLECIGPLQTDCTSCSSPKFLQLSTNRCVSVCQLGSIVDKVNFTCRQCPMKMVGYFLQCVPCSSTCKTCYGTSCLQCITCDQDSTFYISTCLSHDSSGLSRIVKSSARSIGIGNKLFFLLLLTTVLCLSLQLLFTYKTPLLTLIQFIQIIGYMYFFSVDMSQQVQRILSYFYYVNFSAILSINVNNRYDYLPVKITLMGKTGYYIVDSLFAHVLIIVVVMIMFLLKKARSLSRIFSYCYNKLNPHMISYTYRLLILDQAFSTILYFRYGNISTPLGIASLVILLLDFILLGFSLLWKVKTSSNPENNRKQYGLFYFNQIKSGEERVVIMGNNGEDSGSSGQEMSSLNMMLTMAFYIGKIPFPLTMVYFITNSTYQCIAMLCYSLFFFFLLVLLPYKRLIYRTLFITGSFTIILCSGLFLAINHNSDNSIALEIIFSLYIIFILIVSVLQLVINYKYLFHVVKYTMRNVCDYLLLGREQGQEEDDCYHRQVSILSLSSSDAAAVGSVNGGYYQNNNLQRKQYSIGMIQKQQVDDIQVKQSIINDVPKKKQQQIERICIPLKKQVALSQSQLQSMNFQNMVKRKMSSQFSGPIEERQQARQQIMKETQINENKTIKLNNNSLSTIFQMKRFSSEREQTEVDLDIYL